ncbi:hypothetical protein [Deinococcus marmoris]|uniref:hypothetical protein n=1 Tax=Deinococcus marmoris TaxID=249408 RepID=UPI00049731AD|nr:hypothetical protein [Deinococcus marmoris]
MPLTLTQLRKTVAEMDAPELQGLIEELFKANVTNKRLLTALLEGDSSDLLAKLDSELLKAFRDEGRMPTMKVGGAKKALAAYLKVASPIQALDAELRYVEAGIRCLNAYGDWPENNYSSMEKVFESALKRARTLDADAVPHKRLAALVKDGDGFGYGFSDQLQWLYDEFMEELEED